MTKKRKYAVPMKVVRLVQKVQKHILEEPKRFDMDSWTESIKHELSDEMYNSEDDVKLIKQRYPACGTTACIGGWVAILSRPLKKDKNGYLILPNINDIETFASKALKLNMSGTDDEGSVLATPGTMFHQSSWPFPFREQYRKEEMKDKPNYRKLAKIAVARLDHFLYTGQ